MPGPPEKSQEWMVGSVRGAFQQQVPPLPRPWVEGDPIVSATSLYSISPAWTHFSDIHAGRQHVARVFSRHRWPPVRLRVMLPPPLPGLFSAHRVPIKRQENQPIWFRRSAACWSGLVEALPKQMIFTRSPASWCRSRASSSDSTRTDTSLSVPRTIARVSLPRRT